MVKNILYIVLLITISSCKQKYRWSPSECAPKHYPAKILTNDYRFKNGGGVGTLGRTAGGSGWGHSGASYAVGERLKPVPDSLIVNWFSVTEGKFYKGRFKLNQNAIEKELKEGDVGIYTCFAPHGRVVVYTAGKNGDNAVERFRAIEDTAMTVTKYRLNNSQVKSVEQYVKEYGKEYMADSLYLKEILSKEIRDYVKKHGIPDRW
ncbi:DUF2931 family protein [Tenacibaculum ovolyticum]|uniref:DUF2931 family protein n=1 Tax=Tenacibaculum ovolyticum TaxID=104270 RepID=UPI001F30510D|nr:DUF2931 family protein [Tenacibaculum ovolyticum]